jgi:hypothetical protein
MITISAITLVKDLTPKIGFFETTAIFMIIWGLGLSVILISLITLTSIITISAITLVKYLKNQIGKNWIL